MKGIIEIKNIILYIFEFNLFLSKLNIYNTVLNKHFKNEKKILNIFKNYENFLFYFIHFEKLINKKEKKLKNIINNLMNLINKIFKDLQILKKKIENEVCECDKKNIIKFL